MFYNLVLGVHSINRYVVFFLLLGAVVRAFLGWQQKKAWSEQDRKILLFTTIAMDIQLTLGIILYIISPIVQAALQDMGTAMGIAVQRFYVLEHAFYNLLAVTAAHIGSSRVKKAADALKQRTALVFMGLAFLLVLLGMPWDRILPSFLGGF